MASGDFVGNIRQKLWRSGNLKSLTPGFSAPHSGKSGRGGKQWILRLHFYAHRLSPLSLPTVRASLRKQYRYTCLDAGVLIFFYILGYNHYLYTEIMREVDKF